MQSKFVPVKQVFSIVLTDSTAPGTFRARYRTTFNTGTERMVHGNQFEISIASGLVNAAAAYSNSSEAQTGTLASTIELLAEGNYPATIADFTSIPLSAFTPEARTILAIANPGARLAAWHQAGFGDYIACGYGLRGAIVVQLSLAQTDKFSSRASFFDFSAEYKDISASGQISKAVSEAYSRGGINVSIYTEGLGTPPVIPPSSQLSTLDGQIAWGNVLNASAAQARMRSGVYLMSAHSLVNGPNVNLPSWNGDLVSQAATEAENAMETVVVSGKWNRPSEALVFLGSRMLPPPSTMNFRDALDHARTNVGVALSGLRSALTSYLAGTNSLDPVHIQELVDRKADVRVANQALAEVLFQLGIMTRSLPPPSGWLTEDFTAPASGCDTVNREFHWVLDNVAAFTNGTYQSRYEWLQHHRGPEFTICLHETGGCVAPGTSHYSEDMFPLTAAVQEYVYTDGDRRGLKRLTFSCNTGAAVSSPLFRGEVVDDFARVASFGINANQQ